MIYVHTIEGELDSHFKNHYYFEKAWINGGTLTGEDSRGKVFYLSLWAIDQIDGHWQLMPTSEKGWSWG